MCLHLPMICCLKTLLPRNAFLSPSTADCEFVGLELMNKDKLQELGMEWRFF